MAAILTTKFQSSDVEIMIIKIAVKKILGCFN